MGPYHTPGAMRGTSVFASFSPTQFSFSRPAPRCLNSKCICAHLSIHGRADLKKEVCSGALLACCHFEELKIDCAIDQLKPGLKSIKDATIPFFQIRSRKFRVSANSDPIRYQHSFFYRLLLCHSFVC